MINTDKIYKTMMTWKDQQVTDNSTDEWLVRDLLYI
jgi:hypothetical protein